MRIGYCGITNIYLSRYKFIFKKEWLDKGINFVLDWLNSNEVHIYQQFASFSGKYRDNYLLFLKSI